MTFTIDGKPAQQVAIIDSVRNYLDALPHGKMVTTQRVALDLGLYDKQVTNTRHTLPDYYIAIRSNKNIWGNPETIRAYRDELRRTA